MARAACPCLPHVKLVLCSVNSIRGFIANVECVSSLTHNVSDPGRLYAYATTLGNLGETFRDVTRQTNLLVLPAGAPACWGKPIELPLWAYMCRV